MYTTSCGALSLQRKIEAQTNIDCEQGLACADSAHAAQD